MTAADCPSLPFLANKTDTELQQWADRLCAMRPLTETDRANIELLLEQVVHEQTRRVK